MTTESRSQCSRCRGCTSSTRLRGRHRRRSHLMYHRRTPPCIHRPNCSSTCTNRGATAVRDGRGAPARGPSRFAAGRDMAASADLRPVSGCDSSAMCCGPDHVPNSAAAARNGQSGICRHRDEDVSSIENHKIQPNRLLPVHKFRDVPVPVLPRRSSEVPLTDGPCYIPKNPKRTLLFSRRRSY